MDCDQRDCPLWAYQVACLRRAKAAGNRRKATLRRKFAIPVQSCGRKNPLSSVLNSTHGHDMTLSDLASIGSLVSGVAVLISLVYLSLQVKQAERNQRALMQQGRANRVADQTMRLAESGMSTLWGRGLRGDESLTLEQLEQFMLICRVAFLSAEDSFLQHLSGQLNDTAFKSFVTGARSIFKSPGLRAAWRLSANLYGDEYVRFMNGLMKETTMQPEAGVRANWLEALRTDKVGSAA